MFLIRIVFFLLSSFFFLAVAGTALAGFLAFTGSPEPCVDRAVDPAPEADADLQANWLELLQGVDQGETVPLSLNEEQASALGENYLEGKDVPVDDFRMVFCPDGVMEAMGSIGIFGLKSHVLVGGTLDVAGEQPRVDVDNIEVGNIPSFLSEPVLDILLKNRDVYTLPLTVNITGVQTSDGEAIVTVAP